MRTRNTLAEQELGHTVWTIVQLFYRSHTIFREQFDSYERKVLEYSRQIGIHRKDLRLKSTELAGLLDFKSLERLRDDFIWQLKELCHSIFRGQDSTDIFDRYVSDIFHEISILKEEHYNVKTYAPLYERDQNELEAKHILDEAHTLFPEKLRHIRHLYGKAQERLEAQLPSFRGYRLFVRSLYIHRDDFVKESYPDGIGRFYCLMYPGGPAEGFYEVGQSFLRSGFLAEAAEALEHSLRSLAAQKANAATPPDELRAAARIGRAAEARLRRLREELSDAPSPGEAPGSQIARG